MIDIQLVEDSGAFWVAPQMDGSEMRRHGPYPDAATAEIMAARLAAVCRVVHNEVRIGHTPAARQQWAE